MQNETGSWHFMQTAGKIRKDLKLSSHYVNMATKVCCTNPWPFYSVKLDRVKNIWLTRHKRFVRFELN